MPAFLRKRDSLVYLQVALPGESEEPEWQISIRIVTQVIHHEDLMLRRIDLLLNEGKFRDAYELLFVLERNAPGWPGTIERRHRLLLLEGLAAVKEGRAEAGMAYDQMLAPGNQEGAAIIQAGVDGLVKQAKSIERAVAALGLDGIAFEGSDSLDDPNAVFQ